VYSPLIGVQGVATRRAGLTWERTRAEKRSNHVHSPLIGGENGKGGKGGKGGESGNGGKGGRGGRCVWRPRAWGSGVGVR
jgi:hypothetical protein